MSKYTLEQHKKQKILGTTNAKTVKGEKKGYATSVIYLTPYKGSGRNLCAYASKGCAEACLNTAGRGRFSSIQESRYKKSRFFLDHRETFMKQLAHEIKLFIGRAQRKDMIPCIRLNGTSDIPWEKISVGDHANIFEMFPDLQFYDYTKNPHRKPLSNYHLTFSRSESNEDKIDLALSNGMNVAVVFDKVPDNWKGHTVIDGDETDLRFLDPAPCIVGLKAKGDAKKDDSGFVVKQ